MYMSATDHDVVLHNIRIIMLSGPSILYAIDDRALVLQGSGKDRLIDVKHMAQLNLAHIEVGNG